MADEIVREGQNWLNQTYGGRSGYCYVEPNGFHGSAMSAALVSAMQIELGMSTVTGVFGEMTKAACDANPIKEGDIGNRVKILQYGFYNKGYDPGSASGVMTAETVGKLRTIQHDAGLMGTQVSAVADGLRVGAVLGVDEYVLVSGGSETIRSIQQDLNRRYLAYTGLRACDGHYGRPTNEALIYAIQAEEGMSTSMATGYFGPSTKSYLPDLWESGQYGMNGTYNASQISNFTLLAQYALYCVGCNPYNGSYADGSDFNPGSFSGMKNANTLSALHKFQQSVGLPVRDMVGLNEWMGMLTSTGNPNRDAAACDCATQLTTPTLAQSIVNEDYSIVGRYLTGTVGAGANKRAKNLTRGEMQVIFNAGLRLFCIYQDDADWWQEHDDLSGYFSYNRGYSDAKKAFAAAATLGVPSGEYIFFAVDYDFMRNEVYSKIIPHFKGIKDCFTDLGSPYRIGIYSARNTCGIVSNAGLSSASFVSDMSTGYSGNLGFPLPSDWVFDQIKEYTNSAGVPIDKDVASGRYVGFDRMENGIMPARPNVEMYPSILTIVDLISDLESIYKMYSGFGQGGYDAVRAVLDFLRRNRYNGFKWDITDGLIDKNFVEFVENSNPTLANQIDQYLTQEAFLSDKANGQIDLAHLAATLGGYYNKGIVPGYWAGWGGDLGSGAIHIMSTLGSQATLEEACAYIGSTDSECNYSDICMDADAIVLYNLICESSEVEHPVSRAIKDYYTNMVGQRYFQYSNSLGCACQIDELKNAVKAKLTAEVSIGDAGTNIDVMDGLLKSESSGDYPSPNVIDVSCEAFARYVVLRSQGY